MSNPPKWPVLHSEPGPAIAIARVRFDTLRNPRTDQEMVRVVLETPDWVNVIALTEDNEVVLVRQFRFGSRQITTEIPGGICDPHEDSKESAIRELREETGYTAPTWTYLGAVEPNPAFLDNKCHTWLAEGATLTHPQSLDPGEDIVVETCPLPEIPARIAAGEIQHSLVICAFYAFDRMKQSE